VRDFERLKAEVAYPEAAARERFQSERVQAARGEVLVPELLQTTLMGPHFDTEALKDSQRIIAYVIGVHGRNNCRVDIKLIAQALCEHLPGSFHGT
jgi:hypothetical protein